MASSPPRVFISYSHDSPEHRETVLRFAERLRKDGVDAQIDQYVRGRPPGGWPRWMLDKLDWADFVLLVCTETYYHRFRGHEEPGKGKGVDWEGQLVTLAIYNAKSRIKKFVPVVFESQYTEFVPEPVSDYVYCLDSKDNYDELYGFITGQVGIPLPELGVINRLPSKDVEPLTFDQPGERAPPGDRSRRMSDQAPRFPWKETEPTFVKRKGSRRPSEGLLSRERRSEGTPPQEQADTVPSPLTSFIGRGQEQKLLRGLLQRNKLLTITGPPGAGKTRVAIELARSVRAEFDSVWFVELSQLEEEGFVPQRVATVLGIREQAPRPPTEVLADFLRSGKYVLVLDNCEHLIKACGHLANYLLRHCPQLKMLATSRTILNVAGEQIYAMPPLHLPDPERLPGLDELSRIDSIQLLLERARARSNFKLTDQNASEVAALCRGLEGIPLAIELAAAQLDTLTVGEILNRLNQQLDLLVGGAGGEEERQWASLEEAITLSYTLLDDAQRVLFCRLSIFHRGWTLEGAAAICGEEQKDVPEADRFIHKTQQELDIVKRLGQLYHRSLLVSEETNGKKRFRLLDAIRAYAQRQLANAAEQSGIAERHAKWFVGLAEKAEPEFLKKDQAQWLDALTAEADNLRAAIQWAVANCETEIALRLTGALWRLTEIRGYYSEGIYRLKMALDLPGSTAYPALRSKALSGLGVLFYRQGDITAAETHFRQSLEIERHLNNLPGIANALNDLGNVAHMKGDFQAARACFNESLEIERKTGNTRGIAVAFFNLGKTARRLGAVDEAAKLLQYSLQSFESEGNLREAAFPLNVLSWLALERGDLGAALDYVDRSLKIREKLADKKGVADSKRTLGAIRMQQGDFHRAYEELWKSAELARGVDDKLGIAESLEQFAAFAAIKKDFISCVTLISMAEKLRCEIRIPLAGTERTVRDSQLGSARSRLGEQVFVESWEEGRLWSIVEAFGAAARLQKQSC
jgi:predicted ATPase